MSDIVRKRVVVSGVVQGVFFRSETQRVAQGLGLSGWVRNVRDGSVEAVFEGPEDAVDAAVAWCADGPPRAVVEDLAVEPEPAEGLVGFTVRH